MALTVKRTGFGQVEPNHLSGIVTGQIYAQLPAKKGVAILEQGQFAKYDYANGEVNFTGEGEFMLVYNEEKLYDERKQSHKDFALQAKDFIDGTMTPRLIKTNVGDIYTTNTFGANTSDSAEVAGISLSVGDKLVIGSAGYLEKASDTPSGIVFQVIKEYTMPDGQPGVKIQRIA